MKCLTIWNPWAAAILIGGKDVENRPWRASEEMEGQRFYVHAGKQYRKEALGAGPRCEQRLIHGLPEKLNGVRGAVIGSVELVRCTEAEDCQLPWCMRLPGGWAWLLRKPLVYREAVPLSGALGLFDPAIRGAGVVAALEAAEAQAVTPAMWWRAHDRAVMRQGMDRASREGRLGSLD